MFDMQALLSRFDLLWLILDRPEDEMVRVFNLFVWGEVNVLSLLQLIVIVLPSLRCQEVV